MRTVEFIVEAEQDWTEVRGNVMCSGDDDFDKECEDRILADLNDGNRWAWASVKVTARIQNMECSDYLGCCNYRDEEDFRKDAYYLDMKGEALRMLRNDCEGMMEAIERAENDLAIEREAYDKRVALIELWRCPHCKGVISVDPGYDDIPFCSDCDTQRDRFDPIDVVFLRDTDDGDVFAVFPGDAATVGNPDHMTCYARMGGHSGACKSYCAECVEVTKPSEYADLLTELGRIGYNPYVIGKARMDDSKYTDARLEQLGI